MRDSRKSQMLWNNYRYRVEDDSIVIEDYCGEELDVSIPAEIEGLPVKKIAPEAFSIHGAMIERVEVPGSVTIGVAGRCLPYRRKCPAGDSSDAVVSADHSGKTEMSMGMGKSSD